MLTPYKHVVIDETKGAPSPEDVARIEQTLGVALPQDFFEFLNVANGGSLEYLIRVPPTPDGEEMLFGQILYAGRDRGYDTFLGEIELHRQSLNIPPEVLPFARDGGGSTVFLDLTVEGQGRVMAFVEGLPAWTGLRQGSAFIEVAPSFDAYIDRLYLDEEYAFEALEEAIGRGSGDQIQANVEYLNLALPDWPERRPDLYTEARNYVQAGRLKP